MEYNKDYTTKTAEEWFSLKKWTGFLKQLPTNRQMDFVCDNLMELSKIRTTASMLSNSRDYDRKFTITTPPDYTTTRKFYIKAEKKPNGNASGTDCPGQGEN